MYAELNACMQKLLGACMRKLLGACMRILGACMRKWLGAEYADFRMCPQVDHMF